MADTTEIDRLHSKMDWMIYFADNGGLPWSDADIKKWKEFSIEIVDNFKFLAERNEDKAVDALARSVCFHEDKEHLVLKLIEYSGINQRIADSIRSIFGAINTSEIESDILYELVSKYRIKAFAAEKRLEILKYLIQRGR